jgi:hypothetical protein
MRQNIMVRNMYWSKAAHFMVAENHIQREKGL